MAETAATGSLFFDPKQEQEIKRKRKLADQLMAQGQQPQGTEVINGVAVEQSPFAGLVRALTQGAGAYTSSQADDLEAEKEKKRQEMFASALQSMNGVQQPAPPAQMQPQNPQSDMIPLGVPPSSQIGAAPRLPVEVSPLAGQGGAAPMSAPPFGVGDIDNSKALAPQLAAALRGDKPPMPMSPQQFQQAMGSSYMPQHPQMQPTQAPQEKGGLTRENLLQLYMADPQAAQLMVNFENSQRLARSGGMNGGATGALADRLIAEGVDPLQAILIAKSGIGSGNTYSNGGVVPMSGMLQTLEDRKRAEKYGEKLGGGTAEGKLNLPAQSRTLDSFKAKAQNVSSAINDARQLTSGWSTGIGGQLLSGIGGTDAKNLSSALDTVKSNLGFNELQEMRNNSPTGGALGAVSERENSLLQSTVASLEQSQSQEQFLSNLKRVEDNVVGMQQRLQDAYDQDLARFGPEAMRGVDKMFNSQMSSQGRRATDANGVTYTEQSNGQWVSADGKIYGQ